MDSKLSALNTIPTVDRTANLLYVVSSGVSYKTTPNQLLGIAGNPVGDTDTATLTNKTLTSPTISSPALSGTLSGTYTLGGTPTFPSSVVTLTGSQTLTNKTLTSPTINTATIVNPTITADSIAGFTTSNTGTIYGVGITTGVITSANSVNGSTLVAGTVGSTALATNAVQASQLATSAITLGYAQITANLTTTSTTVVQATGLTVTVTIPAGGRRIKISAYCTSMGSSGVGLVELWDGTVGSGTKLQQFNSPNALATGMLIQAIVTPAAGSKTYNVGFYTTAGTNTLSTAATDPAFILVEAI